MLKNKFSSDENENENENEHGFDRDEDEGEDENEYEHYENEYEHYENEEEFDVEAPNDLKKNYPICFNHLFLLKLVDLPGGDSLDGSVKLFKLLEECNIEDFKNELKFFLDDCHYDYNYKDRLLKNLTSFLDIVAFEKKDFSIAFEELKKLLTAVKNNQITRYEFEELKDSVFCLQKIYLLRDASLSGNNGEDHANLFKLLFELKIEDFKKELQLLKGVVTEKKEKIICSLVGEIKIEIDGVDSRCKIFKNLSSFIDCLVDELNYSSEDLKNLQVFLDEKSVSLNEVFKKNEEASSEIFIKKQEMKIRQQNESIIKLKNGIIKLKIEIHRVKNFYKNYRKKVEIAFKGQREKNKELENEISSKDNLIINLVDSHGRLEDENFKLKRKISNLISQECQEQEQEEDQEDQKKPGSGGNRMRNFK